VLLGTAEVALALAALTPRWRAHAVRAAVVFHLGVLLVLSPLGRSLNCAVWPWNLALAVAAPVLLGTTTPSVVASLRSSGASLRAAALTIAVLLPAGFHAGFVDAPLASQVYTMNGPQALWLRADGRTERVALLPELDVFLPPVPRIQAAWFARASSPGDRLAIREARPLARLLGHRDRLLQAPSPRTVNP
jgi:hypothetical protein